MTMDSAHANGEHVDSEWWREFGAELEAVIKEHRLDVATRLAACARELRGVGERIGEIVPGVETPLEEVGSAVDRLSRQVAENGWRDIVHVVRRAVTDHPVLTIAGAVCGGAVMSAAWRSRGIRRSARGGPCECSSAVPEEARCTSDADKGEGH